MGIVLLAPIWGSAYFFYETHQSRQRLDKQLDRLLQEEQLMRQEDQLNQIKKQTYSNDKRTGYGLGK